MNKLYRCEYCDYSSEDRIKLLQHIREVYHNLNYNYKFNPKPNDNNPKVIETQLSKLAQEKLKVRK